MHGMDKASLPALNFKTVAESALAQLNSEYPFGVWLLHPKKKDGYDMVVLCSEDFVQKVKAKIDDNDVFSWLKSIADKTTSFKSPRIVNDTKKDKVLIELKKATIGSYIAIPVYESKGNLFGTLCALDTETKFFDKKKIEARLKHISEMLMIIHLQEEEIYRLKNLNESTKLAANSDKLTSLNNLRGWDKLLKLEESRYVRYKTDGALAILDMDGLKKVNDEFGHAQGDIQLKKLALILKNGCREHDIVARLGGDEFGLYLYNSNKKETALTIERLRKKFTENGLSVSIGFCQNRRGRTFEKTMQLADKYLYEEKLVKHRNSHRNSGSGLES